MSNLEESGYRRRERENFQRATRWDWLLTRLFRRQNTAENRFADEIAAKLKPRGYRDHD